MDTTLQQIIARIPQWADQAIQVTPLAGGLTNHNYRVDVNGESFVVRVCGCDTEWLGINRQHEYECNVIAAEVGIAPEVLHFFPDLGSLVTRFVAGQKIPADAIGQREPMQRVVRSIRALHQSPRPFPSAWSPFRMAEAYRRNAQQLGCPMPDDIAELFAQMAQIELAMYGRVGLPTAPQPVPCHNDLLNENFLDDGVVRIIDYEYSAMGDLFFDLANFSSHHKFDDEQDVRLIETYFSSEQTSEVFETSEVSFEKMLARLNLMKLVSDFREALWGVVQINLSKLDFDYQGYANEFFGRYREKWGDGGRDKWLEAIK
jgi:thiamine kinase-like enzyme